MAKSRGETVCFLEAEIDNDFSILENESRSTYSMSKIGGQILCIRSRTDRRWGILSAN